MALTVFSGPEITLPALRGDHGSTLTSVELDITRQTALGTFAEVTIGGSGAAVPEVGIIFPVGVPTFCA